MQFLLRQKNGQTEQHTVLHSQLRQRLLPLRCQQAKKAGELLETALQNTIDCYIRQDIMKNFLIEKEKEALDMYAISRNERTTREAETED